MDHQQLTKEQTYEALALAHARAQQRGGKNQTSLPTIKPGSVGWIRWELYFRNHLGFEPIAMKRIRWGVSQEMTVPDDLPEQFDGSYQFLGNQN